MSEINEECAMKSLLVYVAFVLLCPSALQAVRDSVSVNKKLHIYRFECIGEKKVDTIGLDTIVPTALESIIKESKECSIEPILNLELKDKDKEKEEEGTYFLYAHYFVNRTTIYIGGKVKHKGKVEFHVHAQEHHTKKKGNPFKKIEEALARQVFNDIIIGMEKKIRVGITEFPVTSKVGGFSHYESAIPSMLGTYLNISPKLTIVESRTAQISREIQKGESAEFDTFTVVEYGKLMMVNYLIMGQCWQEAEKLRIDIRCVRVENAEIIASKGITVPSLDIGKIERQIKVLASFFRSSIIDNVNKGQEAKVKSLVVLGLPPYPSNPTNKKLTSYIVEAAVRKLIKASDKDGILIKEAHRVTQEDAILALDRMEIAASMDADILFALRYHDYGRNDLLVKADILDFEEPTKFKYNQIKQTTTKMLEDTVNVIVFEALEKITNGKLDSTATMSRIKDIPVRRVAKTHGVGFTYGSIMTPSSGPLHSTNNSSFTLSAIFPVPGRLLGMHPDNFRIMSIVTWDWGDGTLNRLFLGENIRSVHQFSLILAGRYDLWPYDYFNIYFGAGVGVLWLRRIRDENESFLHAPTASAGALAALLGVDCGLTSNLYLVIPTKVCLGIPAYSPRPHEDVVFYGGNFFGFNIGLGLFYRW
jgi:hypothetical protein